MQDPKAQEVIEAVTQKCVAALGQVFPDMAIERQEAESGAVLLFGPFPTFIISVSDEAVQFLVDVVSDPSVSIHAYEAVRDEVPACHFAGSYALKADGSGLTVDPQEVQDLRFYHLKRAVAARLAAEAVEQMPKIIVPDNKIIA